MRSTNTGEERLAATAKPARPASGIAQPTLPNWGRSRQRARFGGATAQAPRFCCQSTRPPLGGTKSPKDSSERVLEAQRLISVAVPLGDPDDLFKPKSLGDQQNLRRLAEN